MVFGADVSGFCTVRVLNHISRNERFDYFYANLLALPMETNFLFIEFHRLNVKKIQIGEK